MARGSGISWDLHKTQPLLLTRGLHAHTPSDVLSKFFTNQKKIAQLCLTQS